MTVWKNRIVLAFHDFAAPFHRSGSATISGHGVRFEKEPLCPKFDI
jgi:hypothetical protein